MTLTKKGVRTRLDAMRGRRIVVVGDLMLDRYVFGEVSRISPEAPVPVVEASRTTVRLGGAGNVAANLAALGAVPVPVGVVGDDLEANELVAALESSGIDAGGLVRATDRPTTMKTRIIARNQQVVRLDVESLEPIDPADAAGVLSRACEALEGADGLLVSDYGKGVIERRLLDPLLAFARERGIRVSVDPKESHVFTYRGADVLTPNQKEASEALGRRLRTDDDVTAGGRELRERIDATGVLITRGADGMTLFESDRTTHLDTVATEVYDVTGAGDTVVSVVALARAAGATLIEAATLANHAASLVVREVGTHVVTSEELLGTFGGASGA